MFYGDFGFFYFNLCQWDDTLYIVSRFNIVTKKTGGGPWQQTQKSTL
jgi:hypothetical protein